MNDTPAVRSLREERETKELQHLGRAQIAWEAMTKDQQTLVRFGMFDVAVMAVIEAEKLWDMHLITVKLMDMASKNGGMRA